MVFEVVFSGASMLSTWWTLDPKNNLFVVITIDYLKRICPAPRVTFAGVVPPRCAAAGLLSTPSRPVLFRGAFYVHYFHYFHYFHLHSPFICSTSRPLPPTAGFFILCITNFAPRVYIAPPASFSHYDFPLRAALLTSYFSSERGPPRQDPAPRDINPINRYIRRGFASRRPCEPEVLSTLISDALFWFLDHFVIDVVGGGVAISHFSLTSQKYNSYGNFFFLY